MMKEIKLQLVDDCAVEICISKNNIDLKINSIEFNDTIIVPTMCDMNNKNLEVLEKMKDLKSDLLKDYTTSSAQLTDSAAILSKNITENVTPVFRSDTIGEPVIFEEEVIDPGNLFEEVTSGPADDSTGSEDTQKIEESMTTEEIEDSQEESEDNQKIVNDSIEIDVPQFIRLLDDTFVKVDEIIRIESRKALNTGELRYYIRRKCGDQDKTALTSINQEIADTLFEQYKIPVYSNDLAAKREQA